jgi:hypothetical protein
MPPPLHCLCTVAAGAARSAASCFLDSLLTRQSPALLLAQSCGIQQQPFGKMHQLAAVLARRVHSLNYSRMHSNCVADQRSPAAQQQPQRQQVLQHSHENVEPHNEPKAHRHVPLLLALPGAGTLIMWQLGVLKVGRWCYQAIGM